MPPSARSCARHTTPISRRTLRASSSHVAAFSLLALTNLLWAGNWVLGRALRDSFDPVSLNFWRWFIALVVLTPFGLRAVAGKGEVLRAHAGILALLALLSVPLFQTFVYQGLRTTTAINAVLLNSSAPLFMIACSWLIERERATPRQITGMLISLAGVVLVGANAAGFTLHLLPAFGTLLAIAFLDEAFRGFHAVGVATILAGVLLATYRR